MITSIFRKSSPVNYTLVVLLLTLSFFSFVFFHEKTTTSLLLVSQNVVLFLVLVFCVFLTNFIVKKNGLTKNSSYAILFFTLFLAVFPEVFTKPELIIANFFVMLAIRRLISLQTLKAPKEKIFDAALWIFAAAVFHFWAVLFIILVYVSIILNVSRDYRNWLIPFVSLFAVSVLCLLTGLLTGLPIIDHIINNAAIDFRFDYFESSYQNIAIAVFAVFAVYFVLSAVFSLTSRPLVLQGSYKKIVVNFIIGIAIYVISPEKNNAVLIFTFFPMAVMATNNLEYSQNKLYREIVLALSILLTAGVFVLQL